MQIKKHKFFSHKLSLLAPVFALFVSITSIFALILLTSNNSTFAAPGAGGTPTTVSFALDASSVDFHFTPAELSASTFKQDAINASISTNNPTGFTFYVSSIDEDTNLNHTDSSVTTKIASITSPLVESNFTPKSWGYSADGVNFKPIPKASAPDTVLTTTNTIGQRARVEFGVKASPDLNSGTYSKQVLLTAVTNAAPATATFLPGPLFNNLLANIAPASSAVPAKHFKKSTTAPANIATATVVSTADSGRPIYMWYDTVDQTIYWWSEADDVFANEDSSSMFSYTYGRHSRLDTLDLSGINTINVKNMSRFFFDNGLQSLDLSVLDTRNVENMSYMFSGFEATILPDLTRLNTGNVKDMSCMFSNAHFPSLDLRHFDTHNVETMYRMFSQAGATSINLSGWDVRKNRSVLRMFWDNRTVKTIDMSGWKNDSLELMDGLFSGLPALESINLTGFTTNNVRSFTQTFSNLPSLTSLDLSSIDTSNIEHMRGMFDGASGLTSLDVSNFNTSKVVTMEQMFRGLKVSSLDLHNFDTHNVVSMNEMFSGLTQLTSLNISSFNTSNVTTMSGMFSSLFRLSGLDLRNFDTSKVTDMSRMFSYATNLASLNLSSFNTSRVQDMAGMFSNAMRNPENSVLDISSFTPEALLRAPGMFSNSFIKTIYVNSSFSISTKVVTDSSMFVNCKNLVGGNGTAFQNSRKSSAYARIDAPGIPGYFTLKP